jgi:cyclase
MNRSINRRHLLFDALAGAAGVAAGVAALGTLPVRTNAQAVGAVAAHRLTDKLTLLSGAGTNIVAATGPDSVLLVDGGRAESSAALADAVGALTDRPSIAVLFNTNWRPEHTGLNAAVRHQGGRVIAHTNTKLWMGNDFTVPWEDRVHKPQPAEELPTDTFYKSGHVDFGSGTVEYGYLAQAHTDGDIYVFFPDDNVLAVSDLLTVGDFPIVDYVTGGWIGGLEAASAALLEIADADTLIVPAVGPAVGRAELARQLEFCSAMKDAVGGMIKNGRSLEEVIAAAPTQPFDAEWSGDPELFLELAYQGLWGHIRELGGVL